MIEQVYMQRGEIPIYIEYDWKRDEYIVHSPKLRGFYSYGKSKEAAIRRYLFRLRQYFLRDDWKYWLPKKKPAWIPPTC